MQRYPRIGQKDKITQENRPGEQGARAYPRDTAVPAGDVSVCLTMSGDKAIIDDLKEDSRSSTDGTTTSRPPAPSSGCLGQSCCSSASP
jgi:hypothetical protein